ncbi:high mobility group protein D-like [Drosophila elegans]|uniref:high mobility group protein D-like n=1 Tax=Drosophila elegans TaxID=30023 RepID=UPI001BC85028|nr:high mobility group protein D-like [Drosophila elegans]XP_041566034.1 high mobility group protein D-like [Drosophila elegans]XP_041566074.1 high mobility group protein D-like [Drosophila elegans]
MADKPKRPLSAYMLWLNSAHESIKRENPGIKVTEVAKRGGELWRAMKDKSEWEAKAAKAKDDYDRAVKEFEDNGGGGGAANGGAKKRAKPVKKASKKSKRDEFDEDNDDESK